MVFRADGLSQEAIFKKRWLIAAVMNLGLVMVVMAVSSVNVTLPTLVEELDASARQLQWIVDSYALTFAGLLLPMGALGDRFGRRHAFLGGLAVFAFASFFASYAGSANELIAWRGLMGVGAALIMPATLSIITNVFPDEERPKAVAMWAGFAGAGASIGPVVAGLLLEKYWWGSVFLSLIPVIAVAALLTIFFIPNSKDPHEPALDFVGAGFSILGLGALLFGIIEAPEAGWLSGPTIIAMVVAVVAFYGFIRWEKSTSEPMLPMDLFSRPNFSVGSAILTLIFFAMFGMFFVLIQYLQFVLALSALDAALWTLPMAGTFIAVSPMGPVLAKKLNQKVVAAFGIFLGALGMLSFTTLSTASNFFPDILLPLLVMGSGMALAMPLATDAIVSSVPKRKAGVGSAMNDTTREVGGALGIAILGSILSVGYRSTIEGNVTADEESTEQITESIGGALRVSQELPNGGEIVATANNAFVQGMSAAFTVGGLVLLATSAMVFFLMPKELSLSENV